MDKFKKVINREEGIKMTQPPPATKKKWSIEKSDISGNYFIKSINESFEISNNIFTAEMIAEAFNLLEEYKDIGSPEECHKSMDSSKWRRIGEDLPNRGDVCMLGNSVIVSSRQWVYIGEVPQLNEGGRFFTSLEGGLWISATTGRVFKSNGTPMNSIPKKTHWKKISMDAPK